MFPMLMYAMSLYYSTSDGIMFMYHMVSKSHKSEELTPFYTEHVRKLRIVAH